jgi:hypothetical protein
VRRIRRVVGVPALVLASGISACGHASARNTVTLTNDTSSAVTVRDCGPDNVPPCGAAAAKTLAPNQAVRFPLSSAGAPSAPAVLIVTGFGSGDRCFHVPPSGVLPEPVTVDVTKMSPDECVDGDALPSAPASAAS